MGNPRTVIAGLALSLTAVTAKAESWTLAPALSNVTFASIKNDYVGENHRFERGSGSVDENGTLEIKLGLASVETNIDIRNERMIEHIFGAAAQAVITAKVDLTELKTLIVGEGKTVETFGTLSMIGTQTELDAKPFVMRLSEDQVMVLSDGMIMLSTEDSGLVKGIDVLQELAGLESITRVSPVTLRLVFDTAGHFAPPDTRP